MTTLVTGQVIDTPLNVNLDIWAEIRRLETDRARLVVDWGNGNNDFSGCGACRLENKYTEAGRYTVSAKVVDLNAPSGSPAILSVTVTLNVYDLVAPPTPLACAAVGTDFSSFALGTPLPLSVPGVTFSSGAASNVSTVAPFASLSTPVIFVDGPLTITFGADKNYMQINFANVSPATPVTFQAYDAAGSLVASGAKTAAIPSGPFFEDTLAISGPPFRRVVLSYAYPINQIVFDNLSASCR
jgi:hypothetical protein